MTDFILFDTAGRRIPAETVPLLISAGTQVAFDAAANSDDPEHLALIFQAVTQKGPYVFGSIFQIALDVMTRQILQGAMEVALQHGTDLRPMIRRIAATKPDREPPSESSDPGEA